MSKINNTPNLTKHDMSENQIDTHASGSQNFDCQYNSQDFVIVSQGKINTFKEDLIE